MTFASCVAQVERAVASVPRRPAAQAIAAVVLYPASGILLSSVFVLGNALRRFG